MAILPSLLANAPLPKLDSLLKSPGYDDDNLAYIKSIVAIVAIIALAYEASREADGRPLSLRVKRVAGGVFAVIGIICYFQFFQIGYKEFYHRWEFFHYYVGSKYYKQIGYEGLYTCAAVAENDLGYTQDAKTRKLRDMSRANSIVDTTEILAHPERCKDKFSPETWEDFKRDVDFFRRVSLGNYWKDMQKDHGYNPTPVWGVTGWLFAKMHYAVEWYMQLLSCLDIALFAGMFGMLAWAFGWRVMCIAVVFWGTQYASPFYWTGGAFLRQDWLFYLVGSACMARKQKYFWSGAFLTYSTLLRVFPLFFFFGWFVTAAAHFVRTRGLRAPEGEARDERGGEGAPYRSSPTKRGQSATTGIVSWLDRRFGMAHRKLAAGALAAGLVLIPASVAVCGPRAWPDFIHHIQVHNTTPLTNHVGWKTLVAHAAQGRMQVARDNKLTDPFDKWKAMRRDRVSRLAPIYYGGMFVMLALFAYACWRIRTPWIALALGCLPATVCVELTCYYYSYFILAAPLSRGRRPIEFALLIAAALSDMCWRGYGFFDDRFTAMSVVFVELALFLVVVYTRRPWPRAGEVMTPATVLATPLSVRPPASEA